MGGGRLGYTGYEVKEARGIRLRRLTDAREDHAFGVEAEERFARCLEGGRGLVGRPVTVRRVLP